VLEHYPLARGARRGLERDSWGGAARLTGVTAAIGRASGCALLPCRLTKVTMSDLSLGRIAIVALLGRIGTVVYAGATRWSESGEEMHQVLANILLGPIALHVLAVCAMSRLTRENLIGAFVTGAKRATPRSRSRDARLPHGSHCLPSSRLVGRSMLSPLSARLHSRLARILLRAWRQRQAEGRVPRLEYRQDAWGRWCRGRARAANHAD
jgi:hypothetical protein